MTLNDIEVAVYDRVNLGPNPDPTVQRYVRRYINDVHREVLTKKGIGPRLRRQLLTFATSSSTPFCTLPQSVARIFVISDRTNMRFLQEMTLSDVRYDDPGLTSSSSTPIGYVIMNMAAPVATDPAAATQLFIISTSASDGSGVAVNIEGITSDGQLYKASVSMNGLTSAAIGTVATWIRISKFYLSSPAQGVVSLKDSSGNTLGQISPGHTMAKYTRLHIVPPSTAAVTLYADVELRSEDMMQGSDESLIPEDFHDILVEGALEKEYRRRSKPADAGACMAIKNKRIKELQIWLRKETGVMIDNGRPRSFSQLGPYYESGT